MILVVDAWNKSGQMLIPMLIQKGYAVRTITQIAEILQYPQSTGIKMIARGIHQPNTLLRAYEGMEALVSSINIEGNDLLIDAAKRLGVKHFVFVSAYHPPSKHSAAGQLAEYQTEAYLKTSGLNYTILRPTVLMDIHCADLGIQVMNGQKVTIYGDGRNPINFISAPDVARFIVFALEDPRLRNQTITIGGPQNLTFEEVVYGYEKVLSKCVTRKHISARRLKFMSWLFAPLDKTRSRCMTTGYELATSNWCLDMSETIKHYPIKLTNLEEWILETTTRK